MINPYFEGTNAVPYDKFGGRHELCVAFRKAVFGDGARKRALRSIVQGQRGLGKSRFRAMVYW